MTIDEKLQYENLGFLHLPGIIPPGLVERVSRAFDAAAARYIEQRKAQGMDGKALSTPHDIPDILDQDECFVELVDMPSLLPTLLAVLGPDIQLNHTHARLFPPGKTVTAPWHSDLADMNGIDLAHSIHFFVKVHFYFEDLMPNQGCLAFLPGTHRLPQDFPRPRIEDIEHSPAVVKIVPKAGDCVLFNTHCLHMALDNTSPKTRKSIIYAYSHTWVKNYPNAVPRDLDKYATSRLRRQILGMDEPGVPYFEQRYDSERKHDGFSTLRSASRRLITKIRGKNWVARP